MLQSAKKHGAGKRLVDEGGQCVEKIGSHKKGNEIEFNTRQIMKIA